jgi:hypothetical protein
MRKYRSTWWEALTSVFDLVWRPHALMTLIYIGTVFGFVRPDSSLSRRSLLSFSFADFSICRESASTSPLLVRSLSPVRIPVPVLTLVSLDVLSFQCVFALFFPLQSCQADHSLISSVGEPAPIGYGYSSYITAAVYATPIVAVIIGELTGRYVNDAIANRLIARNKGVFVAEMRLWTCWLAQPFCTPSFVSSSPRRKLTFPPPSSSASSSILSSSIVIVGFCLLGVTFEKKLNIAGVVFGWGLAEFVLLSSLSPHSPSLSPRPSLPLHFFHRHLFRPAPY